MKTVRTIWAAFVLVGLMALLAGCGKKGPPVPPQQKPPKPVESLDFLIEDDMLTLTWSVSPKEQTGFDDPAGFRVQRAIQPDGPNACLRCPLDFETVAELPLDDQPRMQGKGPITMTYTETLAEGNRYTYRVVSVTRKGVASRDAEQIAFVYPQDQKE